MDELKEPTEGELLDWARRQRKKERDKRYWARNARRLNRRRRERRQEMVEAEAWVEEVMKGKHNDEEKGVESGGEDASSAEPADSGGR